MVGVERNFRADGARGQRVVGRPPSRHAAAGKPDNRTAAGSSQVGRMPGLELSLGLAGSNGREALSTHLSVTTSHYSRRTTGKQSHAS
jgi:hypothetical protein